jgi:non-ribosomal peptide synthase protein (TIGR01720 family)
VHEVLLSGLAAALATWRRDRGLPGGDVVVAVEGHGREEQLAEGTDLSSTVGWFTTLYPVRLAVSTAEAAGLFAGAESAGDVVKRTKETLRALPDHGLGYGVLRHLTDGLDGLGEPGIVVNYLGRVRTGESVPWSFAPEAPMLRVPPRGDRKVHFGLEINAAVIGEELHIGLSSVDDVDELIVLLRRALEGIARHVTETGSGGYTPSDLSLVSVTQEDLDEFEDDLEQRTW